ncbi:hypothetical protein HXV84_10215 [Pseudomonas amygdali pv. morsprunorum]|nr:hypothetical protein [Pseudomonas amygdali pv. morsprunorum]
MMTGSRLIAPEGFQCLAKGATYHFLRSDGGTNRVRLVEFADDDKELRSHLITLTRIEFEDALEAGLIVECGITDQHPRGLSQSSAFPSHTAKACVYRSRKAMIKR